MLAPNDIAADAFRPRTTIDSVGIVEGYASLFGEIDSARDMIMPGAFKDTLRLRGIRRIPMLFQHDPSEPVGIWLELREDARGLFARGRLIPEVARARELNALVKAGAVDGLSIGFRTASARVDPRTRVRKVHAVDLWEISIVTFPLLAGARVRSVAGKRMPYAVSVPRSLGGEGRGGGRPDPATERLYLRRPRFLFARRKAEETWQQVSTSTQRSLLRPLPLRERA
ncbi:MAG: HK97 family phage prohead protease [Xanthobacteraceae bacterium]